MDRITLCLVLLVSVACGCQENSGPGGGQPGQLAVAWKNALGSGGAAYREWLGGIPAAADGRVFVKDQNHVVALDASSGTQLWSTAVTSAPTPNLVVRKGLVVAGYVDVQALDVTSGEIRWQFHPDSIVEAIAAVDDDMYYTGQRYYPIIYALNLADGMIRWRANVGADWQYAGFVHGVSVSGDTVYAAVVHYQAANGYLHSGVVVALDRLTGRELWRYETTAQPSHDISWAPLVVGNLLVLDDLFGHGVFAIDRFNPSAGEKWRITSPDQSAGPATPSVVSNGQIFTATGGGYAFRIDAATGKIVWQQRTKSLALGVAVCNGSPYINTSVLERRDANSGSQVGYLHADGSSYFSSDMIADGTRIYVTGPTGVVAALCP